MSRIVSVCLCAVVAFVAVASSVLQPAPALAASGTLRMETPLQELPDPSAPVIALLDKGTVVSIDGPPVDGFYPVTVGDLSGWMRGETMSLQKDIVDDETGTEATPEEAGQLVPLQQDATDAPLASGDQAPAEDGAPDPATDLATEPAVDEPVDESANPTAGDAASSDPATTDPASTDGSTVEAAPSEPAADETATEPPTEEAPVPIADPNEAPIPVDESAPTGPATAVIDMPIRVGPGASFDLITTAPAGSTVEQTGHAIDGYVSVQFADITGWAAADQLGSPDAVVAPTPVDASTGGNGAGPKSPVTTETLAATTETPDASAMTPEATPEATAVPTPTPEPGPTGPASTVVDMPIREGPGPDYGLIFTVPQGSAVQQTGQLVDGYVSVQYKEVSGWSALEELGPPIDNTDEPNPDDKPIETKTPRPGSGVAFTTVDLSLRAGPSADEEPIVVVPAGSRLILTGVMEGNFQRVTYGDQVGWVSNDYLTTPADPTPAGDGKKNQESYSQRQIVRIIYQAADRYGQDRNAMVRVARCESNLDPYAVNPSGSYGLFQFIRSTWKSTPYGDKDIFDPSANANAAAWMWKQGRKSEWVCQ
jgi:uncharacterized protein YraI